MIALPRERPRRRRLVAGQRPTIDCQKSKRTSDFTAIDDDESDRGCGLERNSLLMTQPPYFDSDLASHSEPD